MMRTKHWMRKGLAATLVGTLGLTVLTACGGRQEVAETGDGVTRIVVGAPSTLGKWGNIDENGNLDGYEVAVLKAVDEKLDQYEFDIQGSDFDNILLSLDSGKFDLGTNMYEYNEERANKYLYGQEGYIDFSTYFIVPADSELGSWDSLAGKLFGNISEADNTTFIVKQYNEAHPDKAIQLDYYGNVGSEVVVQSLLDGRWDAIAGLWWSVDDYNTQYGNGKEIVKRGDQIGSSLAYYLYPKDGEHEDLQKAVDGALKELKEDGTLKALSEQYFGLDVTPHEN